MTTTDLVRYERACPLALRQMPPQLRHARSGEAPARDRMLTPAVEVEGRGWMKPRQGGLWTSTYEPGGGHLSAWAQWCLSEEFGINRADPVWTDCYVLRPMLARVVRIDSYDDLAWLVERCPGGALLPGRGREFPDWMAVARIADAVHLTEQGQWATRLSHPYNLYGWDCESTLWFRWMFDDVRALGPQRVVAEDPWWADGDEQEAA
ncbi:MAG TPA: hypothetical protein VF024_12215 [Solirubrobacteraceae bacterium]